MKTRSFREIRREFPTEYLVLVDPEEVEISDHQVEIIGAKYVHAYVDGKEMLEAYRDLKKKGLNITFCTPNYTDRFIVEQVPSLRVMGA